MPRHARVGACPAQSVLGRILPKTIPLIRKVNRMTTYSVSCDEFPTEDFDTGSVFSATREYGKRHLKGYVLLTPKHIRAVECEKYGLHELWRCEAYDMNALIGRVLWIRRLSGS